MIFFEPSPLLLIFIFVQRFVFFESLAILALLRALVGRSWARLPALATLLICALAIQGAYAPALGLHGDPLYADIARLRAAAGGMALPLVASSVFALSLALPQRRWRWIDVLHGIGLAGFLGFWAVTHL